MTSAGKLTTKAIAVIVIVAMLGAVGLSPVIMVFFFGVILVIWIVARHTQTREVERIFDFYVCEFFRKFSSKIDDVTGDKTSSERNYQTSSNLSCNALFRSQSIRERWKDMKRNCDFGVACSFVRIFL